MSTMQYTYTNTQSSAFFSHSISNMSRPLAQSTREAIDPRMRGCKSCSDWGFITAFNRACSCTAGMIAKNEQTIEAPPPKPVKQAACTGGYNAPDPALKPLTKKEREKVAGPGGAYCKSCGGSGKALFGTGVCGCHFGDALRAKMQKAGKRKTPAKKAIRK